MMAVKEQTAASRGVVKLLDGITVGIVDVGCQAVVGVVGKGPWHEASEGGEAGKTVAPRPHP